MRIETISSNLKIKNNINIEKSSNNMAMPNKTDNYDSISFSSYYQKPKKTFGQKLGAGFASLVCPGLGQLINGESNKATWMFFGCLSSIITACLFPPASYAVAGIAIYSAYDAYKQDQYHYHIAH